MFSEIFQQSCLLEVSIVEGLQRQAAVKRIELVRKNMNWKRVGMLLKIKS